MTLLICLALAGYGVVAALFKGVRPKDVIGQGHHRGRRGAHRMGGVALCGFAKSLQRRSD